MPNMVTTTYSVCYNCLAHAANGECGGCYDEPPHDGYDPNTNPRLIAGDEDYGFSTLPCEACGSPFHGDRYEACTVEAE